MINKSNGTGGKAFLTQAIFIKRPFISGIVTIFNYFWNFSDTVNYADRLLRYSRLLLPRMLNWQVKDAENSIFLTFDDGPIPDVTPWVLEQLEIYSAKATFFCVGENVVRHPDLYRKLLQLGHASGNHTYNHLKAWKTPKADYLTNIQKASVLISGKLFRPPHGQITPSLARVIAKNFKIVMWDVLTRDFDHTLSPEKCFQNAVKNTKPGSIVVFHDSLKAWDRLKYVLPRYLEYFNAAGYTFLPLENKWLK